MSSIFQQVPIIVLKSLNSSLNFLTKAEEYIQEKGISEETILSARLASDMFPFSKQIQMISDNGKSLVSRVTGLQAPKYEDKETSILELKERITKTIDFINSIPTEKYDEGNNQKIVLPMIPGKYQNGLDYVNFYGLPNLYFHVVTAYSILRNQGLKLGKTEYLNGLVLHDLES